MPITKEQRAEIALADKNMSGVKRYKDIAGNRYGALVAVRYLESRAEGKRSQLYPWWEFKCDCGLLVKFKAKTVKEGSCATCGALECKRRLRHERL